MSDLGIMILRILAEKPLRLGELIKEVSQRRENRVMVFRGVMKLKTSGHVENRRGNWSITDKGRGVLHESKP